MKTTLLASLILIGNFAVAANTTNLNWNNCSVVEVTGLNDSLMEEGLGSIYDIDEDGNSMADGDSTGASAVIKGNKIELRLGQGSWSSDEYKMTAKTEAVDNGGEKEDQAVTVEVKDGADTYIFRLLTNKKIGRVSYKPARAKVAELLAIIDCSGVRDLRDR